MPFQHFHLRYQIGAHHLKYIERSNKRTFYRVYDPTCGSGSLLIRAARKGGFDKVQMYGQEVNSSAISMARMNMFIHGIQDAKIAWGDTLANPQHLDSDGNLMKFDCIVANMPFSKAMMKQEMLTSTSLLWRKWQMIIEMADYRRNILRLSQMIVTQKRFMAQ